MSSKNAALQNSFEKILGNTVIYRWGGATDTAGVSDTSGAKDTLCSAVGQPLAWEKIGVGATDTPPPKMNN